jgi:hypothetical protein
MGAFGGFGDENQMQPKAKGGRKVVRGNEDNGIFQSTNYGVAPLDKLE